MTLPPPSVGKLEKYVLAYATAEGLAVGRVRRWVSFMMLSGALDAAASAPSGPRFVVKGGVALELRLPRRARATDDLDVTVICDEDDLVNALDDALRAPYGDCTFHRRPEVHPLGETGVRVRVHVAYRSRQWATVQVDLTRSDAADMETERLGGIPLSHLGLSGPADVVCLSLRYHIAQKLHGVTKIPHDGTDNDRFRDAVDLLLLRGLVADEDLSSVREACELTFRTRAQHHWPPTVVLPERWRAPFKAMAIAIGLPVTDLSDAERLLRAFVGQLSQ